MIYVNDFIVLLFKDENYSFKCLFVYETAIINKNRLQMIQDHPSN